MNLKLILKYNNKDKQVYKIVKNLVLFVCKIVKKNLFFQSLLSNLSLILDVPKEILEKRSNQILFKSYKFEKKKFNKKFNFIYIFWDFAILFLSIIFLLINNFIYIKKKTKKYDIICDNIHTISDVECHQNFSKNFKSVLFLSYTKLNLFNRKINIIYIKNELFNFIDFQFKKRLFLFFFIFKVLFYSLYHRINLFFIFKSIIYDFIKYEQLYSQYTGKYYFNYRFYDTNVLHNYLFKKRGGLKTSCFQKNICILSLSCFVYSDIFFTLGNNQGKICKELGGEIKIIKPVGSLFMENKWFNSNQNTSNAPNIDILILGINAPWPRGCINNDFHNSYYKKFIPWIKKISKEFPNKNILYKHHNNYPGDSREAKLLSNSNIKVIIDDKNLNSYGWAFKSKLILSFASTMVVELLGNNKEAYFIDPGGINDQWFYGIKQLNKYKINDYKSLKNLVLKKNYKSNKVPHEKRNYYCLKSNNTIEKISKFLKQS
jgi:hypothetical protein